MTKHFLIVSLISILYLVLRLYGNTNDISNSDAVRWHRRSESFLSAIKRGDWAATYRHYQPGVTLMWINAGVKEAFSIYQRLYHKDTFTLENYKAFPYIDSVSKGVNVLVLFAVFLFQLYLIGKLFGAKTSMLYGFILAIEPYMLGIDRWFHLTSFETYFGFTAYLSVLMYRKKFALKWAGFAGLFLALSVLSKLTGLILLPLFLILIFLESRKIKPVAIFTIVFVLVSFIFFPALWVNLVIVVSNLFSAAVNAIGNDARSAELHGLTSMFFYPLVLLYKLSPITLIVLVIGGISILRKKKLSVVFVYFLYYVVFLSLAQKKIDRYSLVLIPPLVLLAAQFLTQVSLKFTFAVYVIFTCFVIYVYFPVYSAYYSPLFGGTGTALRLGIYDNSGEYFAQAAAYLNQKGRNTKVYVPDNIESFSYYFGGVEVRDFSPNVDYVVRSIDIDRLSVTDGACPTLDQTFGPKGYPEVVFVYRCR